MASASAEASFVVPTFKRPAALAETLAALVALDYPSDRYEVIVVDDGSDESTRDVVDRFGARGPSIAYLAQPSRGVASARNLGASHARSDLLIFLDDDMLVEPDHLRRHLATRKQHDGCLLNGRWEFSPAVRDELERTPFGRFRLGLEDWVKTAITMEPLGDGCFRPSGVTACNLSISARLFASLGGFDESFPFAGCEDQEFSHRAQNAGSTFVYDPGILLGHNDDRVDFDRFCARQWRGAVTSVYLVHRHPEAFADRALLLENAQITPFDPFRLRAKKLMKSIYGSRAGLLAARLLQRVLERIAPDSQALQRVHTMTVGAYIFLGVREGLARHPDVSALATELMRTRTDNA